MEVSAPVGFRQQPGYFVVVALLLIGQGWLTVRLFTPDDTLASLVDDRPLLSGRHALHLYHGMLGVKTWRERGTSCCFDPGYQAGYPKTPIFDGGSRPAEFFQLVGGQRPAAYKLGLAIACLLVPLAFVGMARGVSMSPAASCTSGLLGTMLWWSDPAQALLREGDVDLLLGGLCVLLHVTWYIRFERLPSLSSWSVMTVFAALAWYTQPLLVVGFLPFLILYYLWVATRQGLIWHLAIIAAALVAFGVNANWLVDWSRYLWLYLPFGGQLPPAQPFWVAVSQQWTLLIPQDPMHLAVAGVGLAGLLMMLKSNRSAAWLLGLGTVVSMLTVSAGMFWPVLTDFGTDRFLLIASWCLVLPAAHLLSSVAEYLSESSIWRPLGPLGLLTALVSIAWSADLPRHWLQQPRMVIGLSDERAEIIRTLTDKTTPDARILWEDRTGNNWPALLSWQTERAYLGGLDADGRMEHMHARLCDGKLAGTPVGLWSDGKLQAFLDRYNVGWVVCWNADSIRRFRAYSGARAVSEFNDGGQGVLFKLERRPNWFLKGTGQVAQADSQRIALADIMPEDGEIILSMHHQSRMRVSPGYVQIERDLNLEDPIPFIRLRVPGPVARVSIVWDNP